MRASAGAARLGVSAAEYASRFDALAHALSKTLVVFFVPVFALAFGLLHAGRRRYALEHVTVGTHFPTLLLLAVLLPIPLAVVAVDLFRMGNEAIDAMWTATTALIVGAYGAAFHRRVYGDDRWVAALKATALPLYLSLIYAYRPFLFWVVSALL